jgi:hypothetical protein
LDIARKQLNGLMTALLGDLVDGAPVTIGRCWVEARSEGTPDNLYVPGAGGVENTIAFGQPWIGRFDMRLECTPALEAVVVGNGELSVMQPCIRLRGTQASKPPFGGLPQPVEIGIRGQGLRHKTPSFSVPGDRNSRARKKEMSAQC